MKQRPEVVVITLMIFGSPIAAHGQDNKLAGTEMRIRQILNMDEPKEHTQELFRLGEQAFPVYEKILNDPKSHPLVVARVFGTLSGVQADRHRFVEHAVRRLADPKEGVRRSAVLLLGQIGSRSDASPVVALLWDEDRTIVGAAAETLATIGGEPELTALDIWINSGSHRNDGEIRRLAQQCRNALNKKIQSEKKKIGG